MDYMKTGESVTVEAGINGFIVHTEDGPFLANDIKVAMAVILAKLTNHAELIQSQEDAAAVVAELDAELEPDEAA